METTLQNLQLAKDELESVCVKHGVTLVPVVIHQGNQTFSSIDIVPTAALQSQSVADQPAVDQA